MRTVVAIGLAAISGCAGNPIVSASPQAAELVLQKSQLNQPPNRVGGIFVVDGQTVPEAHHFQVWLSPGSRKIGFLCPGWMFVDGYPSVQHRLEAGRRYELICGDGSYRIELSERPN